MRAFLTSSVNMCAKEVAAEIGKTGQKLAFIYTAAEIDTRDKSWEEDDRQALRDAGFLVTDYTITGKNRKQLANDLSDFDAIYMSGGNSFYLLQQSQKSGFIDVIRDLVIHKGKFYIGTSAGSIVAGPDIYPVYCLDKAEKAPNIQGYQGFGLVNFCIFPHWGSDHFREKYLHQRLDDAYKTNQVPIVILTDTQYVRVEDDSFSIIETKKS